MAGKFHNFKTIRGHQHYLILVKCGMYVALFCLSS